MAAQQHSGLGEVDKPSHGMAVQSFQEYNVRNQENNNLKDRIKDLENQLEDKEEMIQKLEASLSMSEAKFRGMEEAVKVLGNVIVKMSHESQPAGRSNTTNQRERSPDFGQTLARAARSPGKAGVSLLSAPEMACIQQINRQKKMNSHQNHPKLPEGWMVRGYL